MSFEPKKITKDHVLSAIERIEREQIDLKGATKYEVVINGKQYPPKEVMRYAHEEMNGEYLWEYGGGKSTNKFLKAMGFEIKGRNRVNYWIFQGNPNTYDFSNALANGGIHDWNVTAHKDKIKEGDKGIIWLTGERAGVYGLIEVLSDPRERGEDKDPNWRAKHKAEHVVDIEIEYNLFDEPILKEKIEQNEILKNIKVGHQGTNFSATKEEYVELLKMIEDNKRRMGASDFFNSEDFRVLEEYSKVRREKDNEDHQKAYNRLRKVYDKVKYWMNEIQQRNFPKGWTDIRRSPINQGQYFESYQWGKIYPGQDSPKELAYTVAISDNHELNVKIDTVGLSDDDPKRKKYFIYRGEWESSKIIKTFKEKELIQSNWEDLIEESIEFIQSIENDYKNLVALLSRSFKEGNNMKQPLNQILYGPPGTGKTWYLQNHYFSNYTTLEESVTAEQHFNDIVQDLSWWQVIGIALIEGGVQKVSEIRENRWVARKAEISESKNERATIWGSLQMHTITESETVNYKQRQPPLLFDKNENKTWQILEEEAKETAPELYEILDSVNNFNPQKGKSLKRYEFVTFHQSYSYEDFVEGIKPVMSEEGAESEDLKYEIKSGIFKELCKRAESDPDNDYALFIDEINRGNVSAIFGELITLIENDKRKGAENQVTVVLPYSRLKFSVPQNLHIIGTMNTADRSVEALDSALRRRFTFKEMLPDPSKLETDFNGINLQTVLETINARIEMLIDRDHTIGHSYLMNLKGSKEALANAFNDKIVPLLQEYFYGDYGKIGLVLGKGFVEVKRSRNDVFADFSYENANDFISDSYELKKVDANSIVDALKQLLGKDSKEEQTD